MIGVSNEYFKNITLEKHISEQLKKHLENDIHVPYSSVQEIYRLKTKYHNKIKAEKAREKASKETMPKAYQDLWDLWDDGFESMNGKPFVVEYRKTSRSRKWLTAYSGCRWCKDQYDYAQKAKIENDWFEYRVVEK